MASEVTQRQRAEAVYDKLGRGWAQDTKVIHHALIEVRREAIADALRIAKEDGNITAVREQLDRLAREGVTG